LKFSTPLAEWSIVKLFSIVGDEGMCNTKPAYDRLPQELCLILGGNGSQSFSFGPFGKIVDSDDKKTFNSFSSGALGQQYRPLTSQMAMAK
jgi:hypothetical protein